MLNSEKALCPVCGLPDCVPEYRGGVKIARIEEGAPMYHLEERTFLDKEGKATTDQEKAETLLGIAGDEISEEAAKGAGLMEVEVNLESMSYAALKALAAEKGVEVDGSKKADYLLALQEDAATEEDPDGDADGADPEDES